MQNSHTSTVQLFRNTTNQDALNEITMTLGYAYTFDIGKPKSRKTQKEKTPEDDKKVVKDDRNKKDKEFSFSYKSHTFSGAHEGISNEGK